MCIYRHERNQIFILLRSYLHECGKLLILCAIRGRLNICRFPGLRGILPHLAAGVAAHESTGGGGYVPGHFRAVSPQNRFQPKRPLPFSKIRQKTKRQEPIV